MKKTLIISLLLGMAVVANSTPAIQQLPVYKNAAGTTSQTNELLLPTGVSTYQHLQSDLSQPMELIAIPSTRAAAPTVPQIQLSTNTMGNVTIQNLYTGSQSKLFSSSSQSSGAGAVMRASGTRSGDNSRPGTVGGTWIERLFGRDFKPNALTEYGDIGTAPPPPSSTNPNNPYGADFLTDQNVVGPITDTPYLLLLLCLSLYAFVRYRKKRA